jgi:hypothetical protein
MVGNRLDGRMPVSFKFFRAGVVRSEAQVFERITFSQVQVNI